MGMQFTDALKRYQEIQQLLSACTSAQQGYEDFSGAQACWCSRCNTSWVMVGVRQLGVTGQVSQHRYVEAGSLSTTQYGTVG